MDYTGNRYDVSGHPSSDDAETVRMGIQASQSGKDNSKVQESNIEKDIYYGGTKNVTELKKGWEVRQDNAVDGHKKHIHVENKRKGIKYSQNDDGSPHDGSSGSPPKKVKEEIKTKIGWDWDAKQKDYEDRNKPNEITMPELDSSYLEPIPWEEAVVFIFGIGIAIATGDPSMVSNALH